MEYFIFYIMKKLAIDIYYEEDSAHVVGIMFESLEHDSVPSEIYECFSAVESGYISGQFYKRELPPIIDLLENYIGLSRISAEVEMIILDGFYMLSNNNEGLGKHLESYLDSKGIKVEIMGIAKSGVSSFSQFAQSCIRGKHGTTSPLWVNGSVRGKNYSKLVKKMSGEYRLPDILKYLDNLTKFRESSDSYK